MSVVARTRPHEKKLFKFLNLFEGIMILIDKTEAFVVYVKITNRPAWLFYGRPNDIHGWMERCWNSSVPL